MVKIIVILHLLAAFLGAATTIEKKEMELVFELLWQNQEQRIENPIDKNFDFETRTFSAKIKK